MFEKWARSVHLDTGKFSHSNRYYSCETNGALEGWRARQPEIDALKEEIELCHKKLEGLDELIDALKAENEQLRSALKGLLSDTQHVEHEDCEYGPCPVRTARQILKEKK